MRRSIAILAALLLMACGSGGSGPAVVGQYGPYTRPYKLLRLPDGDTVTVYRVKAWTFSDGGPPALQLEYDAPFPTEDSAAARQFAVKVWPVFGRYVEQAGLRNAIITSTNMVRQKHGLAWQVNTASYGLTLHEDSTGSWVLDDGSLRMPPTSDQGEITMRDGTPIVVPHVQQRARADWSRPLHRLPARLPLQAPAREPVLVS